MAKIRICIYCKERPVSRYGIKYCSRECSAKDRIGKPHPHGQCHFPNPNKKVTKPCIICGKSFTFYKSRPKNCCSHKCAGISRKGKSPQKYRNCKCLNCGKIFNCYKNRPRKYCSRKCSGKSRAIFLGEKSPNWKGGRKISERGYILIYIRNHPYATKGGKSTMYIKEHRLVMENHIGRYLRPEEVVHHINGNKQDNRIQNLMLFSNHSKHMIFCKHNRKRQSFYG